MSRKGSTFGTDAVQGSVWPQTQDAQCSKPELVGAEFVNLLVQRVLRRATVRGSRNRRNEAFMVEVLKDGQWMIALKQCLGDVVGKRQSK
jgi:hypothetical protein